MPLPVAHLDLDSFFASVEQRCKPSLRGRAVVVAGLGERGVVTTASYPARELGVGSAMPTWLARRLAPNAAWISPRGAAYAAYSAAAFGWVREEFSRVEQVSVDEAYLDLTSAGPQVVALAAREPREVAALVRQRVWEATGLTCSVAVAGSKLGAKLGSEQAKPAGVTVLDAAALEDLLVRLPVRALPGVGPVSADRLRSRGVATVAELRARGEADLVAVLGAAHGRAMWALAHGRDGRRVEPERVRKSVGAERTFARDLGTVQAVTAQLPAVFDEAYRRLDRAGAAAGTVTVKVRYADFSTETRASSLAVATPERQGLWEAAGRALAATNVPGLGVRLLGVTFSALEEQVQLALSWQPTDVVPSATASGPATAQVSPPTAPPAAVPSPVADDGRPTAARHGVPAAGQVGGLGRTDVVPGAPVVVGAPAGCDVVHATFGRGWLLGARGATASVRFEQAGTPAATTRVVPLGPDLTFAAPAPVLPAQPDETPPWALPRAPG